MKKEMRSFPVFPLPTRQLSIVQTVAILMFPLLLLSCKSEKETKTIIAEKPRQEEENRIQKVEENAQTRQISWLGNNYQISIERKADKDLPLADDGEGTNYYDNIIDVAITRADGSKFFTRKFTKKDFEKYTDSAYSKNRALLGIVFDRAEGNNLCFAAAIGSPDNLSDDYVSLSLKISKTGTFSIARGGKQTVSDEETAE